MHSDLLPNPPLEPTAEKRGGSAAAALGYHALGARPAVRLPAVVLELCRNDLVNPGLPWVTDSA